MASHKRRALGGVLPNEVTTTTATQPRDRRREIEEKYGLGGAIASSKLIATTTNIIQPNSNENRPLNPSTNYNEPLLNLNNDSGYLSPVQPILS
ncbi:unnamed protein product, partial [Didymodactylos carnosus]